MRLLLALLVPLFALAAPTVEPIPAFAPGSRILFQGDSITDGNRGRSADPNHILGHGYAFIIAAKHGAAFPDARLEFFNRGVSGNTVLDLERRWQKDTLDLKPDVLSILIGVNDRGRVPIEQYEQVYDKLLTDARAANPQLKLVLCEPFTVDHKAATPQRGSPSADIVKRQGIVAQLAQKHGAVLQPRIVRVLLQSPIDEVKCLEQLGEGDQLAIVDQLVDLVEAFAAIHGGA